MHLSSRPLQRKAWNGRRAEGCSHQQAGEHPSCLNRARAPEDHGMSRRRDQRESGVPWLKGFRKESELQKMWTKRKWAGRRRTRKVPRPEAQG